ncbi:guanylate cyclase 32E-like [Saccostrea echinata]|uniref:guanylate cyclase 32E-like n=1 Tax=Saccostrea echinata TaxID=191078 RepID=UPI002A7FA100|nr:guanylate cyclase 32E-like [Saccostrea echinata]
MLEIRKDAEFQFNVYLTVQFIITIVSIILTIWYIVCIENMTFKIANNAVIIKSKSKELAAEKSVTESLQYQMLPKKIVIALKEAQAVTSENFEYVTIFISDIVNFTEIGTRNSARGIIDLLNHLYALFDKQTKKYEVLKIETMGDSYMVASGVPDQNGIAHAFHICKFALDIHNIMKGYRVPTTFERKESIKIRIGIHSGPCTAGVLGLKMPRYCLFGQTVNTAKTLKSTGRGGKIHISNSTYQMIKDSGHFAVLERGNVMIKGNGAIKTYWLDTAVQISRPSYN